MKLPLTLVFLCVIVHVAAASSGAGTKTLAARMAGYYEAETQYPRLQGRSSLVRMANKVILTWAKKSQREFIAGAKQAFAASGKPTAPYEYKAEHKVTYYFSGRLVSLRFRVYQYTGGAHGNTDHVVFNFGRVGGKERRLVLADLFRDGADYRQRVSDSVMAKLKRNEAASFVSSGEVKGLTDAQVERFVIDPDGLTFLINPYEVGPYAAGTFEVKLTLTELGPDFNRMMLLGKSSGN